MVLLNRSVLVCVHTCELTAACDVHRCFFKPIMVVYCGITGVHDCDCINIDKTNRR